MSDTFFTVFRYAISLIFGVIITSAFSGVLRTKKDIGKVFLILLSTGVVQAVFFAVFAFDKTQTWYPVHTHLILVLLLCITFRIKISVAIISTLIAYMCCQIPGFLSKYALLIPFGEPYIELCLYLVLSVITAVILLKYAMEPMCDLISGDKKTARLLGVVPAIYYLFNFITTKWSDWLYSGSYHIVQFMPFVTCCAHLVFICFFSREQHRRNEAMDDKNATENRLRVVEIEYESLMRTQEAARIYRHDMRHHLSYLLQLADAGNIDELKKYILENVKSIDSITPRRFCNVEMLNLLLSHFVDRAETNDVKYNIKIDLPDELPLATTELCSMVSNAVENAMNALKSVPPDKRELDVKLKEINRMLIFSVDNTCYDYVDLIDGIPYSNVEGHGYGTRSIINIAKTHGGFADFSTDGDKFKLLVTLKMDDPKKPGPPARKDSTK